MGLSFSHPAALWGLLGLPLILALHFLQSRNRREEVSTLFLLERLPEETRGGAVFTYLRNGLQLWMQLLAVLLLSFLLAEPMWLMPQSIQTVAVVVDSSVSMQAFREELLREMREITRKLEKTAGRTEWWLEPSDPARPGLARAVEAERLLSALENFEPLSGPHSPRQALQRARQMAGPEGLVIYVSDHLSGDLSAAAVAVSVGRPIENCGFTGIEIEAGRWRATLLHSGLEPSSRRLTLTIDGIGIEERELTLTPGTLLVVSGALPEDFRRGILRLDADAYPVDDVLPFVKPRGKPLGYAVKLEDPQLTAWAEKLTRILPGSRPGAPELLHWRRGWPNTGPPAVPAEIWWLSGGETADFAEAVAEGDGLAADLSWEGFLALPYIGFHLKPEDSVELWMGEHPLVVRREHTGGTRLLMNFDPAAGNAMRFPSMLLLLHRFMKAQQEKQPLPFSTQLETRQQLSADAFPQGELTAVFETPAGRISREGLPDIRGLKAPDRPGFYRLLRGEDSVMEAGVFAGDVSEGNFSAARTQPFPSQVSLEQRQRNSRSDVLSTWGFVLLAGVLTLSWWSDKSGGRT